MFVFSGFRVLGLIWCCVLRRGGLVDLVFVVDCGLLCCFDVIALCFVLIF